MLIRIVIVLVLVAAAGAALAIESRTEPDSPAATATPESLTAPMSSPNVIVRPTPTANPALEHLGVYIVGRDGSGLRRLVDGDIPRADLSPDGTEVLYVQGNELMRTNVQTGTTAVIALRPASEGRVSPPRWIANAQYVTFSMADDGVMSTWRMRPDGSELHRIVAVEESYLSISDWLPDGTAGIAITDQFVEDGGQSLPPYHVVRVTADGAISGPLSEYLPCYCGGGLQAPRISPDGKYFAYSDDTTDVYLSRVDGTGFQNITQSKRFEWLVDWASDGKSLVYGTYGNEPRSQNPDFFRYELVSGSVTQISTFSQAVAPDGTSVRGLLSTCSQPEGLIIDSADGTATDLVGSNIPGKWYVSAAEWLPTGNEIMFAVTVHDLCT